MSNEKQSIKERIAVLDRKPRATFAGIPVNYPLLVGVVLLVALLLQWNIFVAI